jgi:hypothetical protein
MRGIGKEARLGFNSWSGSASHKIAQALHDFLGDVIQDVKPFPVQ